MLNKEGLVFELENKLFSGIASVYPHDDFIIVGNNMSGKSWVLKEFLKNNKKKAYFIDSINRTIAKNDPFGRFKDIDNIEEVLLERIKDENFNKIDRVSSMYNNSIIYNELIENFKDYSNIINDYFIEGFQIKENQKNPDDIFSEVYYSYFIDNKNVDELSNGFQAIVRILIEITFAVSRGINVIVIDEIDLHLESEHCKRIIEFLRKRFNTVNWILTTHSSNVIVASEDFNIFKIDNDICTYHDGNDMNNIPYTNRMLFQPDTIIENKVDKRLGDLLRMKILGKNINNEILKFNDYNLTVKQRVLKKYLESWNNEN